MRRMGRNRRAYSNAGSGGGGGDFLPSDIPGLVLWLRSDIGVGLVMSAVGSAGTAPPVVTVTGVPSPALALEIDITFPGLRGIALFQYKLGGVVQQTGLVTGANVALSGTLAVQFTGGASTYLTDNVYTATVQVSSWADQSGNGFNGTSGSGLTLATGINSRIAVNFAAASSLGFVHGNTIISGTAAERFLVFQGAADAPSSIYVDNSNWSGQGAASNIPFTDGNTYDGWCRTTRPGYAKGNNFSTPTIYSSESSGSGGTGLWQARIGGVIIAASVSNTNTFGINAANASIQGGTTPYTLSEVIMYSRTGSTLATNERNNVLRYLNPIYNIPVTLS